MKITYWSDYACPFCYIGVTNLKNALKEMNMQDTKIRMKAFELDPGLESKPGESIVYHLMEKYGDTEKTILGRMHNIREMGLKSGLDIHYTEAKCASTFDAHRITKLSQKNDPAKTERLIEALYKAYFEDGLDLADRKTLLRIASDCGFEVMEVLEVLNTDMFSNEVRSEENEAYQLGIQGVPYFVLDDKYIIPGALSENQMVSAIKKTMEADEL